MQMVKSARLNISEMGGKYANQSVLKEVFAGVCLQLKHVVSDVGVWVNKTNPAEILPHHKSWKRHADKSATPWSDADSRQHTQVRTIPC